MQYNRARWYDGKTGRWLTQDPLGFDAGDSNLYRYVTNRPTYAMDPSGDLEVNNEYRPTDLKIKVHIHTNERVIPNTNAEGNLSFAETRRSKPGESVGWHLDFAVRKYQTEVSQEFKVFWRIKPVALDRQLRRIAALDAQIKDAEEWRNAYRNTGAGLAGAGLLILGVGGFKAVRNIDFEPGAPKGPAYVGLAIAALSAPFLIGGAYLNVDMAGRWEAKATLLRNERAQIIAGMNSRAFWNENEIEFAGMPIGEEKSGMMVRVKDQAGRTVFVDSEFLGQAPKKNYIPIERTIIRSDGEITGNRTGKNNEFWELPPKLQNNAFLDAMPMRFDLVK